MNGLTVLLCFFLVGFVFCESDVLVLNGNNFDEAIESNEYILVEFWRPGCGHCERLKPIYAEAATLLKGEVVLAAVDVTENRDLASRFKISGVPTLYFFKNGEQSNYNGGRTTNEIISWLRKRTGPPAKPLTSAEEFDAFISKSTAIIFFGDSKESDLYKEFIATADKEDFQKYAFGEVIDNAALSEHYESGVWILKLQEQPKHYENQDVTLQNWLEESLFDLVPDFFDEVERFSKNGRPVVLLFVEPSADNAESINVLRSVAPSFRSSLNFAHVDGQKTMKYLESIGFKGKLPALVYLKLSERFNLFFDMSQYNAEAISSWITDAAEGKITPPRKSQAVPESNDEPVKVVVGKNFEEIVLDSSKDVLLEIYAPWCGHCKKLAPIYEQLAQHFLDRESVVIAKCDGTENDLPGLNVEGFPTLYFFPANNKKPLSYSSGDRSLDSLIKFVNNNAAIKAEASGKQEKDEL